MIPIESGFMMEKYDVSEPEWRSSDRDSAGSIVLRDCLVLVINSSLIFFSIYFFYCLPKTTFAHDPDTELQFKGDIHGVSMRVLWWVSDFVVFPDSEWDKDQAREILFKPLDMDETTITFNGHVCRDVTFKREKRELGAYLCHKYNISPEKLGLTDKQVQVIYTSCNLPGFSEFLRLPDRRLLIHMHGVFFFLDPAVF